MRVSLLTAALSATGVVSAARFNMDPLNLRSTKDVAATARRRGVYYSRDAATNPFNGKKLFANPTWAEKLEASYETFTEQGDDENAAKIRTIQDIGTFVWVSDRAGLAGIDDAIESARAARDETGQEQIVGLVLYNLPDRDCSAGESAGELSSDEDGLNIYKSEFIKPYAEKVSAAKDLTFAIVLEPDSLGNVITNMNIEFCAKAAPVYEEGLAYAIASLQYPNVHLYIDAAHGGWLGWDDNLEPSKSFYIHLLFHKLPGGELTCKTFAAAKEFAKVVNMAKAQSSNSTRVRGFATNVSNYNPFQANPRENYTEYSNSWDESHYVDSLSPFLEEEGLPSRFIVDQGRVALPGAREEWGEWCNVAPAGFGLPPGSAVNNTHVDSIVWIKPAGESDGECGYEGAPKAGQWFPEYIEMMVKNANSLIKAAKH